MLYKIELFIYKLVVGLYRPNDSTVTHCDAIVPHGAGITASGKLINSTEGAILRAVELAKKFPSATILLISTNYFEKERQVEENLKLKMLKANGVKNPVICVRSGARNTVDEVRETSRFICGHGLKNVTAVCDEPQMRSAKIIWNHFCPYQRVQLLGFKAEWRGNHRAFLLKSPLRCLLANIIRHGFLIIFGVKAAGKITHPIKEPV